MQERTYYDSFSAKEPMWEAWCESKAARTSPSIGEGDAILVEIFKSRHWAEEGQMWGFLISESTFARLEDYMGLAETAERMGLKEGA